MLKGERGDHTAHPGHCLAGLMEGVGSQPFSTESWDGTLPIKPGPFLGQWLPLFFSFSLLLILPASFFLRILTRIQLPYSVVLISTTAE